MDFSLLLLIAAFGGGLFGASIGGLPAFIFTGLLVLAGVAAAVSGADYDILTNVAFGPIFGPHISFAGGVAAVAYARRIGAVENGKDIAFPLAGLGRPDVLLVGGAFGVIGYLIGTLLTALLGSYTDAVALTVTISAIIVRLAFGTTGLFGSLEPAALERGRFRPGEEQVWVPHQEKWGQSALIGIGVGAMGAYMTITILDIAPDLATAPTLGFGIAAVSLIFLNFGSPVPVTHHMALPAGVAAATFLPIIGGTGALIVGIIAGVLGAIIGEFAARLFLIHGDTHIDPPAIAIFIMTTVAIVAGIAIA